MIEVIIPSQAEFKKYEKILKKMYQGSQTNIGDTNSFEFITENTLFYGFIKGDKVIGAIYFFEEEDKLYLNAYAGRKHLEDNIECVKMSLGWFNCDIYAQAQNRASALCLLKSGFERINSNLFRFSAEQF